jgi:hypothetical protein
MQDAAGAKGIRTPLPFLTCILYILCILCIPCIPHPASSPPNTIL